MATPRRIGDTEVHPVGLGCMNLSWAYGPATEPEPAATLLNHALDLGCNLFDTATIYGMGQNETMVGSAIAHRRDEFLLASKCVLDVRDGQRVIDARPASIKAACEASLKRLGTDVIDLYYMHRPDPNVPIEDSVGALAELVTEGKIRMIGLSEMGEGLLRRAHAVHPIAAMQSEYSLWVRNPEIAVLGACAELGVALVAFSPVGRGFLADPPVDIANLHEADLRRVAFPRFFKQYYAANLPLLEDAKACAAETGCTVAQLALAWTLAKGGHVIPIPGTTNLEHLADNFAAAEIVLPAAMVTRLDQAFSPDKPVGPRYTSPGQASVDTECFDFELPDT